VLVVVIVVKVAVGAGGEEIGRGRLLLLLLFYLCETVRVFCDFLCDLFIIIVFLYDVLIAILLL